MFHYSMNPPLNSARNTLWVRMCIQALTRHTNMICGGAGGTAAGPGTEAAIAGNCGIGDRQRIGRWTHFSRLQEGNAREPNQGSGMEPRWGGETARAVHLLSLDQANEIVLYLLSRYEDT